MTSRLTCMGLVVLMGMGVLLGGCVPKKDYDEATGANNRAQAELANVHKELQNARAEKDAILAQLREEQAKLGAKDAEIAKLAQAVEMWRKNYDELKARYDAALSGAPLPPGPGIALPAALNKLLEEWASKYPELVEYDAARGMVKFKTDLLFPPGGDDVASDGKKALRAFADIIKGAEAAQFHIYIVGHTDDMPISTERTKMMHPTNWYLSAHRAVSVMQELAGGGVPEPRMGVMGFGEFHPVAPNAPGKKGNALNRRVEIWIVPPDRFMTVAASAGGAIEAVPAAANR